jgi:hypothetical protein
MGPDSGTIISSFQPARAETNRPGGSVTNRESVLVPASASLVLHQGRGSAPPAEEWVSIAGVDGAGKSAQADVLSKHLQEDGYSAFVCRGGKALHAWRTMPAIAHIRGRDDPRHFFGDEPADLARMESLRFFVGRPALTLRIDEPVEVAPERIERRGIGRVEEGFTRRFDAAHRELAARYPWVRVDGTLPILEVQRAFFHWAASSGAALLRTVSPALVCGC